MAIVVSAFAAGCSSSPRPSPPARNATHGHPDLAGFLRLPVASPASCPPNVNGTTTGRRSPWVGAVDVSVFTRAGTSDSALDGLRRTVSALPDVSAVFVETSAQAYAEFQRLYTCSAGVSPADLHASLRLVLAPVDLGRRDALVRRLLALPGVDTVSCDPSAPCVDVVRSASASPAGSPR
jgi:hypothetical protein